MHPDARRWTLRAANALRALHQPQFRHGFRWLEQISGKTAQLHAGAGGTIDVGAATYGGRGIEQGTILSADGAAMLLILSFLDEINIYANFDCGTVRLRGHGCLIDQQLKKAPKNLPTAEEYRARE